MTPKHDTAHSGQSFLCHPRVPLTHLGHPKALTVHQHPQGGGGLWWEASVPCGFMGRCWGGSWMDPRALPEPSEVTTNPGEHRDATLGQQHKSPTHPILRKPSAPQHTPVSPVTPH